MAIWTQDDIDRMKAWISSGVKEVNYQGPPGRSVMYQDLSEARKLLAEMIADVNSSGNSSYTFAQSRKDT